MLKACFLKMDLFVRIDSTDYVHQCQSSLNDRCRLSNVLTGHFGFSHLSVDQLVHFRQLRLNLTRDCGGNGFVIDHGVYDGKGGF